jgi:hypothetical protein
MLMHYYTGVSVLTWLRLPMWIVAYRNHQRLRLMDYRWAQDRHDIDDVRESYDVIRDCGRAQIETHQLYGASLN